MEPETIPRGHRVGSDSAAARGVRQGREHDLPAPEPLVLAALPATTAEAQPCRKRSPRRECRQNDHINLKVAGQDGSVMQFKVKSHRPLSKLMKAYCERQGLSMRQIRFRFDGQPINETDTPAQLEMEDRIPLMYSSSRQEEQLPEGLSPYPILVLTSAIER
ncbi:Small ubiquitin-related modifier 3 [Microtus ochrogaster]|uniref:Small ubiquitin-related modifier 2 n=1 Tax=Microtus ochrogaster TaxID=79684 RepID=A0A8J6KZM7_MICOH|nr:Small ubiquitin-related modifier 3 [Microtus ochrogaster]